MNKQERKIELLKPHQVEVKGKSPISMLALAKYNEALSIGYDVGIGEAEEQLSKFRVMVEWARQHYHLPQDVLDVMAVLVPTSPAFDRVEFLKSVLGDDFQEDSNALQDRV